MFFFWKLQVLQLVLNKTFIYQLLCSSAAYKGQFWLILVGNIGIFFNYFLRYSNINMKI